MDLETDSDFLCLHCRQHGHKTSDCPPSSDLPVRDPFADARMLGMLRDGPSSCCTRCEDYQILKVAEEADLVDQTANIAHIHGINHTSNVMTDWHKEQQKHNLDLGPFHSIQLRASCSLCRLIFRVFPRQDEEDVDDSVSYYVRPFPSYDRQSSFLQETADDLKSQYSTYFCVESGGKAMGNMITNFADPDSEMIGRISEAFAISSETPPATRKALAARPRDTQVDALCIEQENTPEKFQQLSIMDVIYQCATVTIVALSGEDSSTGLPGVSSDTPRVPQGSEAIDGKKLLTIFPMLTQDMAGTQYPTRAWTMQEVLLTRCRLLFTNNQIHFWCPSAMFSESIDDEIDPASYTEHHDPTDEELGINVDLMSQYTEMERRAKGEQEYRNYVSNYTERKMTNDSDSLNAFLGIAAVLRKSWFPKGLTWGMPLADFPQALRCTTERGRYESATDMVANYVGVDGQVLILDAYVVTLDIRTDPFSDAFVPGTDVLLGPIKEGNFLHSNTLPSKTEDFLIVERNRYRVVSGRPFREDVYMLLLDWEGEFALRRTKVRLYLGSDVDFGLAVAKLQRIRLK
ncbi:hypothetical protein EG327_009617 [Venturia inaequalis]|uniref:CCHC-type domain-containing protein n=1 Tax=Venturia inaequalis TaxID=5025 RepID=A0A8H3VSV5_VENIN|nr:hypothetical protein EG327_009617 [Venturia inaequalis]